MENKINEISTLGDDYVLDVANTIWNQIICTTDPNIIGSWGILRKAATRVSVTHDNEKIEEAALVLSVTGFCYKGNVFVSYSEEDDYYFVYKADADNKLEQYSSDLCFDELGEVLDKLIETGNMTPQEYNKKVQETYNVQVLG